MSEEITCVRLNDGKKTWCGGDAVGVFVFQNIDHAALNGKNEGRLTVCPHCFMKIVAALTRGSDE